jgi:hypothetical protein
LTGLPSTSGDVSSPWRQPRAVSAHGLAGQIFSGASLKVGALAVGAVLARAVIEQAGVGCSLAAGRVTLRFGAHPDP